MYDNIEAIEFLASKVFNITNADGKKRQVTIIDSYCSQDLYE